ncbi:MAG: hypothetical protein K1X47_05510 [Cyclobacteriaceae bacterium]|nr:hypothetical protein [Cyclobacteriaceae bacterium]
MEPLDFEQLDREEWRELGFRYGRNTDKRIWHIYGDKLGLSNLCTIIEEYVSTKENEGLSEHEHLGPYQYFKIVTWSEPKINEQGLFGSLTDLARFGEMFKGKLDNTNANEQFTIDTEYSDISTYKLMVHVMPNGFDPASMNYATWK